MGLYIGCSSKKLGIFDPEMCWADDDFQKRISGFQKMVLYCSSWLIEWKLGDFVSLLVARLKTTIYKGIYGLLEWR